MYPFSIVSIHSRCKFNCIKTDDLSIMHSIIFWATFPDLCMGIYYMYMV